MLALSELATAAYCPRQLYYERRDDDREPPDEVAAVQSLAGRYDDLRTADDATLREEPIEPSPQAYRDRLAGLSAHGDWDDLVDPAATEVYLRGRDCHGVAHKLLEPDDRPPVPTLVSPGTPPERGVWHPQSVRAVGLAKALAWERSREVPRALVEYPAHGVVRTVRLTTRKKAAYREALRAARGIDGPPPRLRDTDRCASCDYRAECGVNYPALTAYGGVRTGLAWLPAGVGCTPVWTCLLAGRTSRGNLIVGVLTL